MALADKTRRDLVHFLAASEQTISQLADGFEMSLAAVSKHIKVLEKAKLVSRRVEGRTHYIRLVPEQLTDALDWISIYQSFWRNRVNELTKILEQNED